MVPLQAQTDQRLGSCCHIGIVLLEGPGNPLAIALYPGGRGGGRERGREGGREGVREDIPQGYEVLSDLPESQPYTFPTSLQQINDQIWWCGTMRCGW